MSPINREVVHIAGPLSSADLPDDAYNILRRLYRLGRAHGYEIMEFLQLNRALSADEIIAIREIGGIAIASIERRDR